jgi:O-antigen/teichoic acid export membrane protein/ubiquinone/menaquinone biosynthesis C-methylase UbiE
VLEYPASGQGDFLNFNDSRPSMSTMPVLEDDPVAVPRQIHSRGLLSDFTWTLLGNGIFAACQWGIIIILAKLATAEVVGQYSFSQGILTPVLMLAAFNLRVAVASDLKNQFTNREYVGFRLLTLAVGIIAAVLLALSTARSLTVVAIVAIVGLTQAAELTSDMVYGIHQRGGDLVRPATSMMVKGVIGLMALTAGIYWGHSVLLGLACLTVTRAAILLLYDVRGALPDREHTVGRWRAYFQWRRHIQLYKVVFFLGLLSLFSTLISMIPRYFIELDLGSRELGVFTAITSLTAIGLMPVGALGSAAFVRLARAFTDLQSNEVLKILGVLLALSFAIGSCGIIAAYFAGPQILTLLFRPEYAARSDLFLITMIMGAIMFLSASLGISLSAARIFRRQASLLASVGVVEAIACWILVPRMGLSGAVLSCLGAAVVQFIGTAYILISHLWRVRSQASPTADLGKFRAAGAVEKQSLDLTISRMPAVRNYAATLMARIEDIECDEKGRRVLEVGAAAGCLTIALNELGYSCTGVEPDADALRTAQALARSLGQPCSVIAGRGERIPFPDETFDIVITNSVLEHVHDVDACFREISRILKPGGLFWFETASAMSPFQHEIRWFPLFGWYPDRLKKRIMWWAARNYPELVNHTATPAVHWFTDSIAEKKLTDVGFGAVIDRWTLRRYAEGGFLYGAALRIVRSNRLAKRMANIAISECAYAAVKKDRPHSKQAAAR